MNKIKLIIVFFLGVLSTTLIGLVLNVYNHFSDNNKLILNEFNSILIKSLIIGFVAIVIPIILSFTNLKSKR